MKSLKLLAFIIIPGLLATSCKEKAATGPATDQKPKDTARQAEAAKPQPTSSIPPMAAIPDSGKPFFKVAVYKNNKLFVQYEGDWAIALQAGKNMNIQFPASKRMLKIDHGMILYFNSPSEGSFQIAPSGNEREKPVVIFSPEADGAYGIGVSAQSGTVNLTKFSGGQISGNIEAVGKDEKGDAITIQAAFVNIKNNVAE